jgi:hypothetical protein
VTANDSCRHNQEVEMAQYMLLLHQLPATNAQLPPHARRQAFVE